MSTSAPSEAAAGPRRRPPRPPGPSRPRRRTAGAARCVPLVQQVPGPVDDRAQGLLAGQHGTAAAGQQAEAVVEPVGDLAGGEQSEPGRGQFDGERQAVEAAADLGTASGSPATSKPGRTAARARRKGCAGSGGRGSTGRTVSPGTPRGSRLVASTVTPGAVGEQGLGELGHGADDVLAVVEHEQQAAVGAVLDERAGSGSSRGGRGSLVDQRPSRAGRGR